MSTRIEDELDAGDFEDAEDVEESVEDDPEEDPRPRFTALRDRRKLTAFFAAAAVVLAGLGGWFLLEANSLRDSSSTANTALVDTGRTAEVSAAVSNALNQVFSYSYDKTEVTEQAAADLLRGAALDTYDRLFAQVREQAPAQKLVLTTRVVSSAVQYLEGDRARLLVFLDQSATRADADTSNAAAAQLSVTVKREGDRWVITDMEPR
jgi:Mce-associated membrane protein